MQRPHLKEDTKEEVEATAAILEKLLKPKPPNIKGISVVKSLLEEKSLLLVFHVLKCNSLENIRTSSAIKGFLGLNVPPFLKFQCSVIYLFFKPLSSYTIK